MSDRESLLAIEDLKVCFRKERGRLLPVINPASLTLCDNEATGIVGESGSGKTMLCRALIGTLGRHGAVVTGGKMIFDGQDLANAPERVWRRVRGRQIGYVPQSSLAGLNPLLTIETQLVESITSVKNVGPSQARCEALELLETVRIPRARQVLGSRSHELSGGMRQRVMIAAAIAQQPKLLIADEPTTALDVTIQREILNLITSLRKDLGMALILVSHDLAVIEEVCDSVMVMYAGASVEAGPVSMLACAPRHPYTRALRVSRVDLTAPGQDLEAIPGEPVSVGSWPTGCRYWPRCPISDIDCQVDPHPRLACAGGQSSACIHTERMGELG
jgi:oligopeptide/dipeptide ABC transporter ATP-binding protein